MTPKKVLIIGMSPIVGGIEMMIINIIRHIDKSKINFDFLTFYNKCAYQEELLERSCNIFHFSRRGEHPIKSYFELKGFFKSHKHEYDFIWIHLSSASNCTSNILARRYTHSKIISHSHGTNFECKNSFTRMIHNIMHIINHKRFMNCTDYYFACSNDAGKWLYGEKLLKPIYLINNGIQAQDYQFDVNQRNEYKNKLGLQNSLVIGHIGRFIPVKNQRFIVKVFCELHKLNNHTNLILIGEGDEQNSVSEKVHQLGLDDSVEFLGFRDDIPQLLQVFDILILPSYYEGFPLVAIEAQASGIKCFLSDTISSDVNITGLVDFISLEKCPKFWAEQIIKSNFDYERSEFFNEITKSGYDIKSTALWIENFLLSENNA